MAVGQEVAYGFNAGKTRFVSFDRSNTSGAIDVKMDGFIREKKKNHLLRWDCLSLLNWFRSLTSSAIAKTNSKTNWIFGLFYKVSFF